MLLRRNVLIEDNVGSCERFFANFNIFGDERFFFGFDFLLGDNQFLNFGSFFTVGIVFNEWILLLIKFSGKLTGSVCRKEVNATLLEFVVFGVIVVGELGFDQILRQLFFFSAVKLFKTWGWRVEPVFLCNLGCREWVLVVVKLNFLLRLNLSGNEIAFGNFFFSWFDFKFFLFFLLIKNALFDGWGELALVLEGGVILFFFWFKLVMLGIYGWKTARQNFFQFRWNFRSVEWTLFGFRLERLFFWSEMFIKHWCKVLLRGNCCGQIIFARNLVTDWFFKLIKTGFVLIKWVTEHVRVLDG